MRSQKFSPRLSIPPSHRFYFYWKKAIAVAAGSKCFDLRSTGATWPIITNLLLLLLLLFIFLFLFFFFLLRSPCERSGVILRKSRIRASRFTRSDLISNLSLRFCVLIFRRHTICSRWRIYFSRAHLFCSSTCVLHHLFLAFISICQSSRRFNGSP